MTLRIAIDAANLVRDRRGMGRLARGVLRAMRNDPTLAVTLLAERRDRRALAREFPWAATGSPSDAARRRAFDVAWFPFNGMRYRVAAPSVALLHDVFAFSEPHPERIARAREQGPIRATARHATVIATTTRWNHDEIVRRLRVPAARIRVVPPAADEIFAAPEPSAAGDVAASAPVPARYVLVVGGGDEPRKHLATIVHAARVLRAPHEAFVVVGRVPEPMHDVLRAGGIRAYEVDASDAMLARLYRAAALVAVPSREGFGLVAAEAMACGAPVLAADAGGLPEATLGALPLLPEGDVNAWATAIRATLDDDGRRRALVDRATAAYATVDRARHARETIALLREVAAGT